MATKPRGGPGGEAKGLSGRASKKRTSVCGFPNVPLVDIVQNIYCGLKG